MHSHDLTLEHNTIINLSQQRQKKMYMFRSTKMIRLNHIAKIYLYLQT